jgi:hypothetical protein
MDDSVLNIEQKKVLLQLNKKKKMTPVDFSINVESYVLKTGKEYITAIMLLSELYDIDEAKLKTYLTKNLKEKLAMEQHLTKKISGIDTTLDSML